MNHFDTVHELCVAAACFCFALLDSRPAGAQLDSVTQPSVPEMAKRMAVPPKPSALVALPSASAGRVAVGEIRIAPEPVLAPQNRAAPIMWLARVWLAASGLASKL